MTATTPDLELHLAEHRPWLLRQARWRLGAEASAADDVVQETLIAAWSGVANLRGEPTRGWLAGILRHKVADHWRRVPPTDSSDSIECGGEDFDDTGHWVFKVADWGDPEKILEAEGFWGILDLCSKIMPVAMYRVFSLREIDGLSVSEVCTTLGVSESNCHVLLHRARIRLRGCIGSKWGRG
jgi:RNA polymerase sigma-70 factor (ECF subfamily)